MQTEADRKHRGTAQKTKKSRPLRCLAAENWVELAIPDLGECLGVLQSRVRRVGRTGHNELKIDSSDPGSDLSTVQIRSALFDEVFDADRVVEDFH